MSSPNCGDKVEVQLLFMAFFIYILYIMPLFSSSRNRVTRTDIDELSGEIERIDEDIDTLSARIDNRVRLRAHRDALTDVNKDIRSLVDKIEKNKDFIFLAADCNNPGPDVNPVCSRIRQPEEEDDGDEELVGGRRKRKFRKIAITHEMR